MDGVVRGIVDDDLPSVETVRIAAPLVERDDLVAVAPDPKTVVAICNLDRKDLSPGRTCTSCRRPRWQEA